MKTGRSWWVLTGMAILLPVVLYVGAYCYLVKPRGLWIDKGGPALFTTRPEYPSGWQSQCEWLFTPVHKLDKLSRPRMWRQEMVPEETLIQFNHN